MAARIEAVDESVFARAEKNLIQIAAALALPAAHFKQIGEVIAKREYERKRDRNLAVIADGDPVMCDAFPQISSAHNMKGVSRQYNTSVVENVRISEVGGHRQIVVPNARTEQKVCIPSINNSRWDK
jgi:hypothetical protein